MRSNVLISLLPLLLTLAPSAISANNLGSGSASGGQLSDRALEFKQVDLTQRAVERRDLRHGAKKSKRQDDAAAGGAGGMIKDVGQCYQICVSPCDPVLCL